MATAAEVDIINTALGALGQDPVTDLEEASLQGSISATKLVRLKDLARDTVLARHGWICALEYTTLSPALIPGYVNWRYPTVYQLPGNAVRVWEIAGITAMGLEPGRPDPGCWEPRWQGGTIEDQNGGSVQIIRARDASAALNIAYVRRAAWSALDKPLADAIAYDIARRGAYSVVGDRAQAAAVAKEAEARVLMAISVGDTQEGGQPPLASSIPAAIRNLSR